jgi:hypothetical protein
MCEGQTIFLFYSKLPVWNLVDRVVNDDFNKNEFDIEKGDSDFSYTVYAILNRSRYYRLDSSQCFSVKDQVHQNIMLI